MKIGFIGCGNMASAMIGGILRQGIFSKDEIIVSNLTDEGRARSEKTLGVVTTLDNNEIVRSAKTVVLAVKPQFYEKVLTEVHDSLTTEHTIIGIAPGKTPEAVYLLLQSPCRRKKLLLYCIIQRLHLLKPFRSQHPVFPHSALLSGVHWKIPVFLRSPVCSDPYR